MKTKEEILDNKFKERGIRKGWVDESRQAVLDAMDEYADEKLRLYHVSESEIQDALSKILKVGANMITTGISSEISEWNLPKTTPKKTKRKIVKEADKWNDINRRRAIELKSAHDVLSKRTSI